VSGPPVPDDPRTDDPWAPLRRSTPARIGLGQAGDGLPTARLLEFQAAHAAARDAVHLPFDPDAVGRALDPLPWRIARSRAPDRATYLRRPDLGRRIDPDDLAALAATGGGPFDAAIVVADGLSARAVHENAAPLAVALAGLLAGWRLAPVVLVRQGRVAAGDAVAAALGAGMVAVLIGERPGLSAADSLGCYLTHAPRPGETRDSERNCVSNIRPAGLPVPAAAERIARLMGEARRLGLTGIALKDDAPPTLAAPPQPDRR
jgi:ethanolamine ammonia-lyase small subunit